MTDLSIIELDSSPIIEDEDTSASLTKKRFVVYQYYTYKSPRYFCNHCSKSFADKSTTTLWRHINKNHTNLIKAEKEKEGKMDKYINSKRKENVSLIFKSLILLKFILIYIFFSLIKKDFEKE